MGPQRVRIQVGEIVFPKDTFVDLEAAKAMVRSEIEGAFAPYGAEVTVLHLDAAYDAEPEPSIPEEPDPADQIG